MRDQHFYASVDMARVLLACKTDISDTRPPKKNTLQTPPSPRRPPPRVLQAFPMRDQHFYASIDKAQALLNWTPKYGLVEGLKDSYDKDFGRGMFRKAADFECDDMILSKLGKKSYSYA